jgi:hypothetical protein
MKMLSIDPGEKSAWIALFTAMSGRIVPAVFKEMMSGKRKSSAEPTELDDFEAACRESWAFEATLDEAAICTASESVSERRTAIRNAGGLSDGAAIRIPRDD